MIGNKIKEAMERANITIPELSIHTGIPICNLQDYIDNKEYPCSAEVLALSGRLNVSINYLFGRTEEV